MTDLAGPQARYEVVGRSRPRLTAGVGSRSGSTGVFAVRWLPDSRRLVVSAGKLSRDVVLIRSFR